MTQASTLTIATLNLENGRELDLLPRLVSQVPGIDVLFFQFSDHRSQQDASELVFFVADMSVTFAGRRRNVWAIARWRYPSCPLWGLLRRIEVLSCSTLLICRTSGLPPLPGTA
jgi:hypothetical protein